MNNGDTPENELAAWIERLAQRMAGADPALSKALQSISHAVLRRDHGAALSGGELDSATKSSLKARLTDVLTAYQRALDQRPVLAREVAPADALLADELAQLGAAELLLALQQHVCQRAVAEVPSSALAVLQARYARLCEVCGAGRARIRTHALELAGGDEILCESLERVALAHSLTSLDAGRALDLNAWLSERFPKLRDAYANSRHQVRSLAAALTEHNPGLTQQLVCAGDAIIVCTHDAWLKKGRLRKSFSMELNGALRNHFAHLPLVQQDFQTLSMVCDDITRQRVQQFKSQAVHAEDCRQIALAELAKLRIRHATHPYTSFRAAYSNAAHHALLRAQKEAKRNAPYDTKDVIERPDPSTPDPDAGRADSLDVTEHVEAMNESFWPMKTRAKLRRTTGICFTKWWRAHRESELGDSSFPVGEELITRLVAELEDSDDHGDPRNRVNGILTQMRQDVEAWMRATCAAAGCEEVAQPLSVVTITLIAPYTNANGPGLSPEVLPALRKARPKLAASRATPPWLLCLVDWLIAVLEGGLR